MNAAPAIVVVSAGAPTPALPGLSTVSAEDFLAGRIPVEPGQPVVNLCRAPRYLSEAWYVSLLAEARGGRPIPEPALLEQTRDRASRDRALREEGIEVLDAREVAARLRAGAVPAEGWPLVIDDPDDPKPRPPRPAECLRVTMLCGRPARAEAPRGAPSLTRLGARLFAAWGLPLMEVSLVRDAGRWRVFDLRRQELGDLDAAALRVLAEALAALPRGKAAPATPSLAVLWDGADPASASSAETIARLGRVAARRGLRVEIIGPRDLDRLGEHDALFVRTLTGVDQPAWRFATRAEALGMPVIDHPAAIVRCSNKVYLHELLGRARLAMPRTVVFGAALDFDALVARLGSPVIVKVPDGSFSMGVHKVSSAAGFAELVPGLLARTPLLVAQEYLPTTFDWRVGVLDGEPLYAARYHMVPGHWQIRALRGAAVRFGRVEGVALDAAPPDVLALATAAVRLIGDGLFGVDLKETERGPVIVEVNDNPNLDLGYEDAADGDAVYERIVDWFKARLEPGAAAPEPPPTPQPLAALRQPIGRRPPTPTRPYRAWEVVGLELEYPIVDRDLNVVPLAESVLATLAGRPTSDVSLGRVGISNEIVDHVIELKNESPHRSLARAEEDLVEGVRRVGLLLDHHHRARLLPGGMHPWADPRKARLWQRSNRRIYDTYARLFDVRSHGWANVQAVHVNLPFGTPEQATAMLNAARLLVPYLPALAASSPLVEGELTGKVDNRVAWLLEHQARLPESMARLVPEPLAQFSDYKKDILRPLYAAVDRLPDAGALRHEFLNARGAVFKASRASMEVRILDVQECVAMDVSMAWFTRRALRALSERLAAMAPAPQPALEDDLLAVARGGSRARVRAPHVPLDAQRDADGTLAARDVLAWLFGLCDHRVPQEELRYRDLCERAISQGSLSERILAVLEPHAAAVGRGELSEEGFTEAARGIWLELGDCLMDNRPWAGRAR